MSDNRPPTVYNDNIFKNIVRQLRLAWRLFLDPRVHWLTKSLPIIAAIYVISPIDFIPEAVVPILGGMDDLAIAVFGLKLFIEFSPPEVVQEHLRELLGAVSTWRVADDAPKGPAVSDGHETTVVEGEYQVVEDKPSEVESDRT
ncbi:MAG: DUF1232 domain-containing protein [Chloroflexi bacterium]|nr:DUF1232 domain-containing protein [Chloroflexota bacterium]